MAQHKQERNFDKRHYTSDIICVGDTVLQINNNPSDREGGGGGGSFKWLGPFIVNGLSKNGLATLMNVTSGKVLKKRYNKVLFKPCECINADDTFDKGKESITEVDEEEPSMYIKPEEYVSEASNYWNMLPDEIIDKILLHALDSPKHASKTYHNIMGTCKKFQIIKEKRRDMLPRFHVKPDDFLQTLPSYNEKVKISVQKINKKIGECSGLSLRLPEIIGDANWR